MEQVGAGETADALRRAAEINPLFALAHGEAPAPGDGWRSAAGLVDPADPAATDLVGAVDGWLGGAEPRVVASLAVLGYSARLLAPALAVLLRDGLLLDMRPERVWWRFETGRGFTLRLTPPAGWRPADPEGWCRQVVAGHLEPVIAAVRRVAPVAEGLLWGNAASSLAGTLRTLALASVAPLATCRDTGRAMLAYGPLRGTGTLVEHSGQLFFVRRSCCLYYRLPGGGLCGDCALVEPAERQRQWAHATAHAESPDGGAVLPSPPEVP